MEKKPLRHLCMQNYCHGLFVKISDQLKVAVEDSQSLGLMGTGKQKVRFPWRLTSPLSLLLRGEHSPNPLRRLDTAPLTSHPLPGLLKVISEITFHSGRPASLNQAAAECVYPLQIRADSRSHWADSLHFPRCHFQPVLLPKHEQTSRTKDTLAADSLWLFAGLLSGVHSGKVGKKVL